MKRIVIWVLLLAICCGMMTGCWDYRGLDELSIVAGIAIDKSTRHPHYYALTFEIIDINASTSQQEMKSTLLESEGATIFEAIFNASKKLYYDMYFGNTEIMVVSEEVASTIGLNGIIDSFLRDFSTRNNITVIVSREETAREILVPQESGDSAIVSYNLNNSIARSDFSTNATRVCAMHKIYNYLKMDVDHLALPAVCLVQEESRNRLATDGVAIFTEDKLTGFLRDQAVPYFILLTEQVTDGTLTYYLEGEENSGSGEPNNITLQVHKSKPSLDVRYQDGQLTLIVELEALTSAIDISPGLNANYVETEQMEARANQAVSGKITDMIRGVQDGSGSDIFGFAYTTYCKYPALWAELGNQWQDLFREAEVQVNCNITINDTGLIMTY